MLPEVHLEEVLICLTSYGILVVKHWKCAVSCVLSCLLALISCLAISASLLRHFEATIRCTGFSTNLTKAADLRSSLPAQRVTACLPFSHSRSFGQYPLEDSQQSRSRSNVPSEAWHKQLGDSETQLPKNLTHLASSIQVFWICGGLWISRIVLASFQAQGQTSKDMIVEFKRRNSQIWRFETDSCKSRSEEHSDSCTTLNAWRPELSFFMFLTEKCKLRLPGRSKCGHHPSHRDAPKRKQPAETSHK